MQSESKVELTNIPKSEDSMSFSQAEFELFGNKKRRRSGKGKNYSKKEEERILKYALKLSEKEYQESQLKSTSEVDENTSKMINQLEEVTTYYATEEDFKDPLSIFDRLWHDDQESTGIIKVVPPKSWVENQKEIMENTFKTRLQDPQKKLFTRKQKLSDLHLAKKFEHVKEYNYEEYHKFGKKVFTDVYKSEEGSVSVDKIEADYWDYCNKKSENDVSVLYAADISIQRYFNKHELFSMINGENKNITNNLNSQENNFSLLKANVIKNSMLQFTKLDDTNQISGITIPWFYMGMLYSSFCWHTEDLYLYSLNYMHEGSPKIWYGISHTQKEKMDEFIKTKYFATLLKQPDLVHRLTLHINPLELIKNGIKVYRVVQNPGDMIVTLPKGYHCGFSTGLNLAEAVNFSTPRWIDYGLKAQMDYKRNNRKMPVFPIEWVLMQNYENFKICSFSDKNAKNKIKSIINTVIKSEIDSRIALETFFKLNNINYIIEEIDKNDSIENFECDVCTYYGFLSQLQCNGCKRKGCLMHNIQCRCLPTDFTIRVRYMIEDLQGILKVKKV